MLFKREVQDRSLWDAILQASPPALFATTGDKRKAPALDKLRNHSYHVFVKQESEQLAVEATVPDSVISRCQIYKHGTGLSFCFKTVLDVLDPQNCLIYG